MAATTFKRKPSAIFKTMVTANIPNADGGFDESSFMGHYKRLTTEEIKALRAEGLSNEETSRRTLVGWDMVDDDTKQPVPFSPAELDATLSIMPVPYAIAQAFYEANTGSRTKNS